MELPPEDKPPEPELISDGALSKKAFYGFIAEVIKTEPMTSSSVAKYTFNFDFGPKKGSIEISSTDLMHGYKRFEELLFSHFDFTLPSEMKKKAEEGKVSEWNKFVRWCAAQATKIQPEDSIEWEEIDRFLEKISRFNILEESKKEEWGEEAGAVFTLLKKVEKEGTYYCLKASDVAIVLKDLNIVLTKEEIGKIMKKRGIKRQGSGSVRIGKKVVTAWWFTEQSLIEHGLDPERSTIPVLPGGLNARL